jgi:hypothetical protein
MIKKEIKPFDFIEKEVQTLFAGFVSPGVYTLEVDTAFTNVGFNQYPNEWSVNLGGHRVLQMGENGNLNITGQLHALGTLIYDQETNRLKFWNGTEWIPVGPLMI